MIPKNGEWNLISLYSYNPYSYIPLLQNLWKLLSFLTFTEHSMLNLKASILNLWAQINRWNLSSQKKKEDEPEVLILRDEINSLGNLSHTTTKELLMKQNKTKTSYKMSVVFQLLPYKISWPFLLQWCTYYQLCYLH